MSGDHKTIINGNPSQYVKLNVGGHLFHTTIATLTAKPDTMLQAMFSGRMEVLTDSEGNFLRFNRISIRKCAHFRSLSNSNQIKSNVCFSLFRMDFD